MARIAKAYGRGCLEGCAIRIAATAIVFGGVVVGMIVASGLAMLGILPWEFVGVAGLVFMAAGLLLGTPLVLFAVVARRGQRLDGAFPVPGSQVGPVSRGWRGELEGRDFAAWFTKGPMLEIYLGVDAGTRMAIGRKNALGSAIAGAVGARTFEPPGRLGALDLVASGSDEAWCRGLLEVPEVATALEAFFGDDDGRTIQVVTVGPAAVKLTLRFLPVSRITEDNVDRWLDLLEAMATAIETRPGPSERQQESGIERFAREDRGRIFRWTLGLMLLGIVVIFVPTMALVALLIAFG